MFISSHFVIMLSCIFDWPCVWAVGACLVWPWCVVLTMFSCYDSFFASCLLSQHRLLRMYSIDVKHTSQSWRYVKDHQPWSSLLVSVSVFLHFTSSCKQPYQSRLLGIKQSHIQVAVWSAWAWNSMTSFSFTHWLTKFEYRNTHNTIWAFFFAKLEWLNQHPYPFVTICTGQHTALHSASRST